MEKIYDANGIQSKYPLEIPLLKADGSLEDYYRICGDTKERIQLRDLVNEQIEIINAEAANATKDATKDSNGNGTQNASSGSGTQNASNGDFVKNASSGDGTKNVTTGTNSIDFHAGFRSTVKAVNGTWISLAEYEKKGPHYVPCFARAAQVGNPDYLDAWGKPLDENEHYMLYDKQFQRVTFADEILLIKTSEKKAGAITVFRTIEPYNPESKLNYLIFDGEHYSHGETFEQAKESLIYKISNRGKQLG